MSRLNATIAGVTHLLNDYQFGEAGRVAYDFLWGDYADWYIELSKIALNSGDAGNPQHVPLLCRPGPDERERRRLHPDASDGAGDPARFGLGGNIHHVGLALGIEVGEGVVHRAGN